METSEANSHRRTLKVLVVCKQHENGKLLLSWWAAKLMSHWWLSLYYIYKYKEPYNQNLRACQTCFLTFSKTNNTLDCVKSVQIRSFFCSVFSRIQSKYGKIRTRKNSVYLEYSRFQCSENYKHDSYVNYSTYYAHSSILDLDTPCNCLT